MDVLHWLWAKGLHNLIRTEARLQGRLGVSPALVPVSCAGPGTGFLMDGGDAACHAGRERGPWSIDPQGSGRSTRRGTAPWLMRRFAKLP
jgi:hypothetical protein